MKVTAKELRQILPRGRHYLLDRRYTLPSDEEVRAGVDDFIARRGGFAYVPESHDCDNAAIELMAWFSGRGWALGMAIHPDHTMCLYANKEKKVKFIEPQTGAVTDTGKLEITVIP